MTSRLGTLTIAAALVPAATAAAQDPAATSPPAPAAATLQLTPERTGKERTVLAGDAFRVRGVLQPYVPGQRVTVRITRDGRKLRTRTVAVQPSSTGRSGGFVLRVRSTRAGRVAVRATTVASPQLAATRAEPRGVTVLRRTVLPGTRGGSVRWLQRKLDALGYVVGRRGTYDARTARAVTAYRKMTGIARTSVADEAVLRRLLAGKGAWEVRFPSHGRHIEADLSKQVIALIGAGGKVERIYPTSSGAPATPTILGSFRVYRKDPGTNQLGMVHSAYFIRGYAIHGYKSVPTYNASHGCLRVPVPDARSIYDWISFGTRVDVYP